MPPTQQKALFLQAKQGAFALGTRPVPSPKAGELLVRVEGVGLSPLDWKIQKTGFYYTGTYPAVLGTDVSGTVEEVGEGVTGFAKGDKVFSSVEYAHDNAAYQQYALVTAAVAAKVPSNLSLDEAATLAAGIATAALALYDTPNTTAPGGAGFTPPWDGGRGKYAGKPILVLGGASSVGQYVIQFAKLSGFSPIITTASSSSERLVKSFGATHVLDRNLSPADLNSAVSALVASPFELVYDAISLPDTQEIAYEHLAPGGTLILTLPSTLQIDETKKQLVFQVYWSPHAPSHRKVAEQLFAALPELLLSGDIKPNPVKVLPNGLEGIPEGLKELERGVSGVKLVARPKETA
ncbi:GroES-like protein [Heliocybe sulcata]|uniref:GroES-like protein n=1 Tax=Heliocybe sulcata TaxID=5364 RepID=A0A5C3N8G0_9AGAM|nr:GroES-like protein [Heliocybe sulcata]